MSAMVQRPARASPPGVFFASVLTRMEPTESIRRLGFNRWYERRLIEAHVWFVTGILCMIVIAACIEALNPRSTAGGLLAYLAVTLAAIATGFHGFRRYLAILGEAERVGEHATCPGCGVYGRFRLISALSARCRKCAHEWRVIH
jgi:hypothetical protein